MTYTLSLLRTPGAMLAALLLALVAQLEHTAQVFSMVVGASGVYAGVHAYAFAIAVETAVLLFVLAGHRWISYGFALATAATNLSYYAMHGINLFSLAALPAWLMSLLLPAAIMGYSHTIAENNPRPAAEPNPTHTLAHGQATIAVAGTSAVNGTSSPRTRETPVVAVSPVAEPARKQTRKPVRKSSAKLTPDQRRAQIASASLTDPAQVMAQFSVSARTAQADIAAVRKSLTQSNGVHA
jgi:hypothetical protein